MIDEYEAMVEWWFGGENQRSRRKNALVPVFVHHEFHMDRNVLSIVILFKKTRKIGNPENDKTINLFLRASISVINKLLHDINTNSVVRSSL